MEDFFGGKRQFLLIVLLAGLILVGAGVLGFKFLDFFGEQTKVEILGTTEDGGWKMEDGTRRKGTEMVGKLTVEAAGEVLKPGVYELTVGSRVNDLLMLAGGLSAEADREWVARNINLAQRLQDGVKIYVPKKGSQNGGDEGFGGDGVLKININTASEGQLDSLWGIGPATVKKVIEGRPYQRIEELLEKKIVKSNVWEKIKGEITVF